MSALWLGLLGTGCMTYDFEPVTPIGIAQTVKKVDIGVIPPKPALMLVVDKSGSMSAEVSPGVTRLSAMQSAMGTFLMQTGGEAHLGMLPFPGQANVCAGGDIVNIASVGVPLDEGDEDGPRLQAHAMKVKQAIDGLQAAGGTPTAATINGLATYAPLLDRDRDRYAVLLTDGLPNCNDANASVLTTCSCTLPSKPSATAPCAAMSNGVTYNQCLDDDNSAAEVGLLNTRGIRTIVIGFGTDVANPAGATAMAKMAAAGGFNRPCSTAADCNAGDTCNAGGTDPCGRPASTCGQSFFQAGNAAELGRVLQAIKDSVSCPPCTQVLAARPSDPKLITVIVDGSATSAGVDTWEYRDSGPSIEFVGALCNRLMTSTSSAPVKVEIRTVEAL